MELLQYCPKPPGCWINTFYRNGSHSFQHSNVHQFIHSPKTFYHRRLLCFLNHTVNCDSVGVDASLNQIIDTVVVMQFVKIAVMSLVWYVVFDCICQHELAIFHFINEAILDALIMTPCPWTQGLVQGRNYTVWGYPQGHSSVLGRLVNLLSGVFYFVFISCLLKYLFLKNLDVIYNNR